MKSNQPIRNRVIRYVWYIEKTKTSLKVILYSYLILKKMNERITDS